MRDIAVTKTLRNIVFYKIMFLFDFWCSFILSPEWNFYLFREDVWVESSVGFVDHARLHASTNPQPKPK